jgi:hypothetical protein
MATVQSSIRLTLRARSRNGVADRGARALGPSHSVPQTLAFAGRKLLGAALLLSGIMMMSTLLLLPVGLPVALLAVALIAAPSSA